MNLEELLVLIPDTIAKDTFEKFIFLHVLYSEESLNNTSAQRQKISTLDILVSSKMDKYLESYEVSFEDKKISDPQYITYQLNNIEKGLNLSHFNMQPIIKAFSCLRPEGAPKVCLLHHILNCP